MLQAVEAIVNPDGSVKLLEQLKVNRPTRVIMTVVPDNYADTVNDGKTGCDADRLLAWLKSPEYQNRPYGDPDAMERTIQENRDAWGDE